MMGPGRENATYKRMARADRKRERRARGQGMNTSPLAACQHRHVERRESYAEVELVCEGCARIWHVESGPVMRTQDCVHSRAEKRESADGTLPPILFCPDCERVWAADKPAQGPWGLVMVALVIVAMVAGLWYAYPLR